MMHIVFWHWWVLAGLLLVVELAWPRYFLLWLAFAAAAVGFLLLVFPSTPGRAQAVLFGLLCTVVVISWRRYRRNRG